MIQIRQNQKIIFFLLLSIPSLVFASWGMETQFYNEDGLLCWNYTYPTNGVACYHWDEGTPDYFYSTDQTGHKIVIDLKEGVRLEIMSMGNVAYADVYVLQNWSLYEKIKLSVPFDRIFQTSPNDIMHCMDPYVEWKEVLPTPEKNLYRNFNEVLQKIRTRLPIMESLNQTAGTEFDGYASEGFAKWVIDGFYLPKTGHEIPYEDLTEERIEERGGRHVLWLEEGRSSFNGLDWVRNLALKMAQLGYEGVQYGDNDVNYLPEFDYLGDTGYAITDLKEILYLLAIRQPELFFLGSLNERVEDQYNLVKYEGALILFPRIDMKGDLEVALFENGKEYELESYIKNHPNKRIQLVGVSGQDLFAPNRYAPLSVLKR